MLERQKYEMFRFELKKARIDSAMLQRDLSKNLKKPQSYIFIVESGERSLDVIEFVQYCDGLGLDSSKWLKKLTEKF